MRITFDPAKDKENKSKHGISLQRAEELDLVIALFEMDDSQDYGEVREIAIGFLAGNLYVLVFVQLDEDLLRAISLRTAENSEVKRYAEY